MVLPPRGAGQLRPDSITDTYEAISDIRVWTHTTLAGTEIMDDYHCDQWTSDAYNEVAMTGRNSVPAEIQKTWADEGWWTRYIENSCNTQYRLYCFEN